MIQYTVKMTAQANRHVLECAEYIQYGSGAPQAARKLVKDIRKAVGSLTQLPQRNPLTEEEPWKSMGVHKMIVRGYLVYYWIETERKTVFVIGVVYGRRDQANQLAAISFEE